jgi:hypothetical protein
LDVHIEFEVGLSDVDEFQQVRDRRPIAKKTKEKFGFQALERVAKKIQYHSGVTICW